MFLSLPVGVNVAEARLLHQARNRGSSHLCLHRPAEPGSGVAVADRLSVRDQPLQEGPQTRRVLERLAEVGDVLLTYHEG